MVNDVFTSIYIFLHYLFSFYCVFSPKEEKSHVFSIQIPSKEVIDSIIESKRFISKDSILAYIKNIPINNFKEFKGHPFDSIQFNKVIAYEFNRGVKIDYRSIINEKSQFAPTISQQVALKPDDVYFITRLLSNKNTYNWIVMACFMPRLGLVFYQDNQIVMHISICYECNRLESSISISAETTLSNTYVGFNKNARRELRKFLDKHHFPYSKHKSILDE